LLWTAREGDRLGTAEVGLHCKKPTTFSTFSQVHAHIYSQTLSDFKAKSCAPFVSYCWLWILILITIAVYSADTFTAVNLIGFNKWTSGLQPKINLKIAKWIFSGCIILSWTLAIYSWVIAFAVMRRGCVTDDYLDDLAVVLQSIRCGTGWQRFLVFTELTKSKKKVSWIALFVYFQRKGMFALTHSQFLY
jgi:hypothetical protein